MDVSALADQQELVYINSVQKQDVIWKICQERWMIGIDGKRELGKSVLSVWLDIADLKPYNCLMLIIYQQLWFQVTIPL